MRDPGNARLAANAGTEVTIPTESEKPDGPSSSSGPMTVADEAAGLGQTAEGGTESGTDALYQTRTHDAIDDALGRNKQQARDSGSRADASPSGSTRIRILLRRP